MGVWMVLVLVKYLQGATFLQQMASKYHTLRPTRGERGERAGSEEFILDLIVVI